MSKYTTGLPPGTHNRARPPLLTPPNPPPASTTRGKALAVIVSVDNVTTPRYATVAVNDHFPFEGSYVLPMGVGPFAEGVSPANTNINTTSSTAVTSTGSTTITVSGGTGISGISTSTTLTCDKGENAEKVLPTAVGPGSEFVATFTKTHAEGFSIKATQQGGDRQVTVNTTSTTAVTNTNVPTVITVDSITGITTTTQLTYDNGGTNPEVIIPTAISGSTFTATFQYTHSSGVNVVNTTAPEGYFYFYNNAAGVGGSIVWCDLDTRQVLQFTGNVSTIAPSPYYATISGHKHNGNYDPAGYQNPSPVNLSGGEIAGNLPWNNNTTILYGVVSSDGNVIGIDFAAGMLQLITSSSSAYQGLYQQLLPTIIDNVGFELVASQFIWTEWIVKWSQATYPTGPIFTDNPTPGDTLPTGNSLWVYFDESTQYGAIYYSNDGGSYSKITGSDFLYTYYPSSSQPSGYPQGTGTPIQSHPKRLHNIQAGLQFVGGSTWRIVVYADSQTCQDMTISSSNVPGFELNIPIYPGFETDDTTDANNTYFKKYEYHTTAPNTALSGNPNPNTAPVLATGTNPVTGEPFPETPSYNAIQSTNVGVTTFDEEVTFYLDQTGAAPVLNQFGGQVVAMASKHNANVWSQYGSAKPVNYGYSVTLVWGSLGLGFDWDLGIAFIDQNGNITPVLNLGTEVSGNPITVGGGNMIVNQSLGDVSVTSKSGAANGDSPVSTASDMIVTAYLTSPPPSTTLSSDYTGLAFASRHHNSSTPNSWTIVGSVPLQYDGSDNYLYGNSNPYEYIFVQLTNGVNYDFAVCWFGDSGYGPITSGSVIASNVASNPILVTGPYMDNGDTVPAPDVVPSSVTLGSTISDNTISCAAEIEFSLDNQPTDGTLGRIGIQMCQVMPVQEKFTKLKLEAELPSTESGKSGGNGDGSYDVTINNLISDINYLFYATYISNSGRETSLPSTFCFTHKAVVAGSGITIPLNNASSISKNDVLHIYDPSSDAQDEEITVSSVSGNSITATLSHPHPQGSFVVSGYQSGLIGRLVAQDIIVPGKSIPKMPKNMLVSAEITSTPKYSYTGTGGGSYHTSFTFLPKLSGGNPNVSGDPFYNPSTDTGWGAGWVVLQAINNTGNVEKTGDWKDRTKYSVSTHYPTTTWESQMAITVITDAMGANNSYQIAVAPYDYSNNIGPIAILDTLTAAQKLGDEPNLIDDSSFLKVTGWKKTSSSPPTYEAPAATGSAGSWTSTDTFWSVAGAEFNLPLGNGWYYGWIESALNISASGQPVGNPTAPNSFFCAPDGDKGNHTIIQSEIIHLLEGQTYIFTGYIDASTCGYNSLTPNPQGTPYWGLADSGVTFKPYRNGQKEAAILVSVNQPFGNLGFVTFTYTPSANQSVRVIFDSNACAVNSSILVASAPMLQVGNIAGTYKDGPDTKGKKPDQDPNVYDDYTNPSYPDTTGGASIGGFADLQSGITGAGGGYIPHLALSYQVNNVIGTTPDSNNSYILPGIVFSNQIADGAVNLATQISGTLPRGNTDSSITNTISETGYVLGPFYDGTSTRTMSDITSVIASGGELVSGIVGNSALATNAVESTNIASGAVGNTQLASSAVQAQNIDGLTGTGTVSLTNVPDDGTYSKTKTSGVTSGYATSTYDGTTTHNIKGVGDSQTLSLDNEISDGPSTYKRTTISQVSSLTSALDSNGNLYSQDFGGSSSGVIVSKINGSLTNWDGIATSVAVFPTFQGVLGVRFGVMPATSTSAIEVGLGTTTNGYSIFASTSTTDGSYGINRYSGGTKTTLLSNTFPNYGGWSATTWLSLGIAIDCENEVVTVDASQFSTYSGSGAPFPDSGGPWSALFSLGVLNVFANVGGTSGQLIYTIMPPIFYSTLDPYSSAVIITDGPPYIANGAVGTTSIAANAVTNPKIAADAVGAGNINGFTGTGAVSMDNIPDGTNQHWVAAVNSNNYPSIIGNGCLVGSGPSISFGSGAPSGSPSGGGGKGSIYLRTGGSGTGTSLYVYDGSTWTAVSGV